MSEQAWWWEAAAGAKAFVGGAGMTACMGSRGHGLYVPHGLHVPKHVQACATRLHEATSRYSDFAQLWKPSVFMSARCRSSPRGHCTTAMNQHSSLQAGRGVRKLVFKQSK